MQEFFQLIRDGENRARVSDLTEEEQARLDNEVETQNKSSFFASEDVSSPLSNAHAGKISRENKLSFLERKCEGFVQALAELDQQQEVVSLDYFNTKLELLSSINWLLTNLEDGLLPEDHLKLVVDNKLFFTRASVERESDEVKENCELKPVEDAWVDRHYKRLNQIVNNYNGQMESYCRRCSEWRKKRSEENWELSEQQQQGDIPSSGLVPPFLPSS